ncbi:MULTISPECIES: NAD(P)H-dependent glycerol-3-phosphate dehydrogenase [unclassified Chelatococcus]|uniref:NAD(P)H-dependent glycerol-3-phosphate dehydrogenase n=1 Tax=unclassified Chelatococcus TaxID=2638111 RepID=UPI001BCC6115|nr:MULTISPECIES: NAD(P)H-dependent glycerol-3-phosphate dehydrogenase [unclassified Chelatococcus]CAH1667463.1 Glycerol-3-phosphate dehydrogenase (NAD(P)+) [Hyphomicrobiales bacterium]MBS7738031.1 NAD(P)-dependent glycerol-3-phosphate dehydrogenase [Chelatococcus sp. HY11]MBX3546330.1 NAD(P)-dependent glycerol-3-phosphate dehydrogenase [Chelatococcus sp.]MCO5077624.1 NAD(P)-dependent glycerol-3-phosphate dehydrogenase [Chelatococcus sp.]CAH1679718.1 Glycerol-3-phosphate dehydrogenase (NAD(P)+)
MTSERSTARKLDTIAVVGAGAWGTALAMTALRAGRSVRLWAREAEVVASIRENRENTLFLPGHHIPEAVSVDSDLAAVVVGADVVLIVVPSQFLRKTAEALRPHLTPGTPVVICAKGIERGSGLLLATVVEEALPGHALAVLSGPTFAGEVAAGMPTAITVASTDAAADPKASLAAAVAVALGTQAFRPYVSDDVVGVEVGGAVKNVLAIACGIATGLGFGANTRAALITRGLDEIKGLAEALGGRRDTVTGLSGIGDLTLTCSSEQSRNMRYGMGLATGRSASEIFGGRPVVVEGVENAQSVTDLARSLNVDMPICEAVRAVVLDGQPIADVMAALLTRPFRAEPHGMDLSLTHRPPDRNG